jgi:hypothetical protein
MSPMRFPRVVIIKTQVKGWLSETISQADKSSLYKILDDDNKIYILKNEEFYYDYEEQQDKSECR